MTQSTQVVASVGTRLLRFNPLNKNTLLIQFGFLVLTVFGYEAGQAVEPERLFYIAPIALATYFGIFVTLQYPISKLAPSLLRAVLVVMATIVSYLAKSAILLFLLYQSSWLSLLQDRLIGDLTIAVTFYWLSLGILATNVEDLRRTEAMVAETGVELESQRLLRVRTARDFDAQLRGKIEKALAAELDGLLESIKGAKTKAETERLAEAIHSLVETKVRPLAHSLSNSAERLKLEPGRRPIRKKSIWPRIVPDRDTRPWLLFLITVPNLFASVWQNSNLLIACYVTIAATGIPILNMVVAKLIGRRRMNPLFYLTQLLVQSVAGYIPAILVITQFTDQYPGLGVLRYSGFGVLAGVAVIGAFWSAYFFAQQDQIELAEELNDAIRHELSLIDQAIWVAKRRWAYIVHGTIQSALTVAAARLTAGSSLDDAIAAIRVALESIKTPTEKPGEVETMLENVRRTWLGVCDLSWEISPQALERLHSSPTSSTCLVEIVKELVGNAHRHGGASKIWLSVYPDVSGDLQVLAGNNGRLIDANAIPGLGIQLYQELTKDFDFEKMKRGGFHATIALPR